MSHKTPDLDPDHGDTHSRPQRGAVQVIEVRGRSGLRAFMQVPHTVYASDPAWVPPLWLERRLHYSRHNPFLEHGRWQGWVARRDGRPVGRISAQIDELHRARYGRHCGHFGLLDAVDDGAVFQALVAVAERWLQRQGVTEVTGPFNFSVNQDCGLLVEGFDTPPAMMMPHGRPWYPARLEAQGYRPARDLLAYRIQTAFEHPRVMQVLMQRFGGVIRIRPLRRRRMDEELETLRGLFNDAWAGNWGFVPFTRSEFRELGQMLRLFVDEQLVQVAEVDGAAVGFIVGLPDLNEAIADLDGRLLPFRWLRLWRRLRGHRVTRGRVPLMGVLPHYQNTAMGTAVAFMLIAAVQEALLARGIRSTELSWILEDNGGMRKILERIGGAPYKRYRIYTRRIAT